MSREELSLTWADHHSTIVGVFEKLLESSTLVDCTIAAEGQYLKAHKVVLSACSPYFELLFTQENERNPIVVLKDIKFQEVKSMIDFIYRGKVKLPEDRLGDFVAAAESLQIKGLGGNHSQNNTKQKEVSPPPTRKRESCASPTSRKRFRRRAPTNVTEKISVCAIPAVDLSSDSSSCESIPRNEESLDIPTSLPSQPSSSKTSTSGLVCAVSAQERTINFEPQPSTSYVQPVQASLPLVPEQPSLPLLPEQPSLRLMNSDILDQDTESIVKSEPEPAAEVFLTETECLVEPKMEVSEETSLLENANETPDSQQSTSQYTGFQSPIETGDVRTSDSFMVPLAEHSIAQGTEATTPSVHPRGRGISRGRGRLRGRRTPRGRSGSRRSSGDTAPRNEAAMRASHRSGPRACPECRKIFHADWEMQRHLCPYAGERPYQCRVCGMAFKQGIHLRTHFRKHTGERPYACESCNREWMYRSTYLRHMHRVHNESPPSLTRGRPRPQTTLQESKDFFMPFGN